MALGTLQLTTSTPLIDPRTSLPAFPRGWFSPAVASEVKPGSLVARRFLGQGVVVARTAAGEVGVLDGICPHLGADLAFGGRVDGESVRCPFHGFRFDLEGRCVSGYDDQHRSAGTLGRHRSAERNGIVFAWHDPDGLPPTSEPPSFDGDDEPSRWSPLRFRRWTIASHPQEVHENAPDVGHLRRLHRFGVEGYEVHVDGDRFHSSYRSLKPLGGGKSLKLDIDGYIQGLGCAVTNVRIAGLDVASRIFTMTTPTDVGRLSLTIAMTTERLDRSRVGRALRGLPAPAVLRLTDVVNRALLKGSGAEVDKDLSIWEHKDYLPTPRLARGDGPIMQYRQWAEQFYPQELIP